MKKFILIILLSGCSTVYQKPYNLIRKYPASVYSSDTVYVYRDANGKKFRIVGENYPDIKK